MKKPSIMIVEDDVVVSADLRSKSVHLGYDVCPIVRYGEDVLNAARRETPDLILMDIKLKGDMDGIEAARSVTQHLNMPIVFVTAYTDEETLDRAKLSEPFAYLKKPVSLDDLRIAIEMSLYKARMERRLRDSEERFRTVADFSYDWEAWLGPEGNYIYMSPSCERITGWSRESFVQNPLLLVQITHPEDREALERHLGTCCGMETDVFRLEFRIVRPDGEVRWIDHLCQAVFSKDGTCLGRRASNRDITERKRTEALLKETEEKLKAQYKGIPIPTYTWRRVEEGFVLDDCNDAAVAVTHGKISQYIGNTVKEMYGHLPEIQEDILCCFREQRAVQKEMVYRFMSTGEERVLNVKYGYVPPDLVLVHTEDITEQKKAEKALQDREEKYRLLTERSTDMVYRMTIQNERFTYVSPSVERILGYTLEEILSLSLRDVLTSESYEMQGKELKRVLTLDRKGPAMMEVEAVHKKRHVLPLEIHADLLLDQQGKPVEIQGVARDITERKRAEAEKERLEQRLWLAHKRESLGTMAGAVAHHFNNLLQAVMGNLELAMYDISKGMKAQDTIGRAMEASLKASELSRLMLTYVGQGDVSRCLCDLSQEVERTIPLITVALPPRIQILTSLVRGLPPVNASPDGLRQITVNLATNAWESSGDGTGNVSIRTGGGFFDEPYLSATVGVEPPSPGEYVFLEVVDQGCGMSKRVLTRIFDPFYSTKFTGRGLGLATVAGLVRVYQGAIVVASVEGQGTTVRVLLPAVGPPRPSSKPLPEAVSPETQLAAEGGRGKRTVLLAEDNALVRAAASDTLQRLGYEVFAAKDGMEALSIFQKRKDSISVVLSELSLPYMDGWATLEAVRRLQPDIPVVLASIFNKAQSLSGTHAEQPQAFLQKPYGTADLKAVLDQALQGNVSKPL